MKSSLPDFIDSPKRSPKTYWHLEKNKKMPTAYEIATSHLLFYTANGFATPVPVKDWYEQYQKKSPFQCSDWELFADPRQTTYSSYVELQKNKELYVGKIFDLIEANCKKASEGNISQSYSTDFLDWMKFLEKYWPAQRFLFHGLQMVAAYIGQMSPAGRITMTSAFQAADEIRRIQWIAYSMRLLQQNAPSFGMNSKMQWETDPLWQPLRKLIEELLITYDWGEAFVALNIVIKPRLAQIFTLQLAELASRHEQSYWIQIFYSLHEDEIWHEQWSQNLLSFVLQDNPAIQNKVNSWIEAWESKTLAACQSFQIL